MNPQRSNALKQNQFPALCALKLQLTLAAMLLCRELIQDSLQFVKIYWLHEMKIEPGVFGAANIFFSAEAGKRD